MLNHLSNFHFQILLKICRIEFFHFLQKILKSIGLLATKGPTAPPSRISGYATDSSNKSVLNQRSHLSSFPAQSTEIFLCTFVFSFLTFSLVNHPFFQIKHHPHPIFGSPHPYPFWIFLKLHHSVANSVLKPNVLQVKLKINFFYDYYFYILTILLWIIIENHKILSFYQ